MNTEMINSYNAI